MSDLDAMGSVTRWIEEIRAGASSAVPSVWNRYFSRLAGIADHGMADSPSRSMDGEDVASSVLETFFRKVREGQFPELRDRDDLWLLLLAITRCKVVSHKRHELRQKRGGGRVLLATDVRAWQNESFNLDDIADGEPTPDLMISLKDACNFLISEMLRDEKTRAIAILKLEGLTNKEIAERLNTVSRTVERKLKLIRSAWEKVFSIEFEGSNDDQDTAGE
ncbi:MAG: ECF-type sigma factor [Pirellulaceae bacterium]|nr:ECF-type sigma factor [Pirellulaceae bacterium]